MFGVGHGSEVADVKSDGGMVGVEGGVAVVAGS